MKRSHRQLPGYTLMELMLAIAVVILLAGTVIAVMPGALRESKRQETRALITRIENGLEVFYERNGYYPRHPHPAIEGEGIYPDEIAREGSAVLYRTLSGDFDMDGEVDIGVAPYVDHLPAAAVKEGQWAATDMFGARIRYISAQPGKNAAERRTRNPGYDLWSLGGAKDPDNSASWLTR